MCKRLMRRAVPSTARRMGTDSIVLLLTSIQHQWQEHSVGAWCDGDVILSVLLSKITIQKLFYSQASVITLALEL
jgi:hypothetical protein